MKVYTYYEDINFKHQDRLLEIWKKSWASHGYEPIVLGRADAEKHPYFSDFEKELCGLHQLIANKTLDRYGLSCWLRWLAYATQAEEKFYVCDYDVINHHFCITQPESDLCLLDGDCPCIASGTPSQFFELCLKFVSIPNENKEKFADLYRQYNFVHYHDQEFFRICMAIEKGKIKATRRREVFFGIPGEGEFWKKQLVHYGHSLCHRYCEQRGVRFSEEERCNVVEEYLKL
jgi:hypothetical protein